MEQNERNLRRETLKAMDCIPEEDRSTEQPSSSSEVCKLLESIKQDPSLAELRAEYVQRKRGISLLDFYFTSVYGCWFPAQLEAVPREIERGDRKLSVKFRDIEAPGSPTGNTNSGAAEPDDGHFWKVNLDVDSSKTHSSPIDMLNPKPVKTQHAGSMEEPDDEENKCYRYSKVALMVIIWLLCTAILMMKSEKLPKMHQISVPEGKVKSYWIKNHPTMDEVGISIEGALLPQYYSNLTSRRLYIWLESFETKVSPETFITLTEHHVKNVANISETWSLPLVTEDAVPEIIVRKVFQLQNYETNHLDKKFVRIQFKTNLKGSFPISLDYDLSPIDMENGVIYAALVLLGLYVLIIFEITHRTLAAMLASTMSVAILAALDKRPAISEVASWIDFETLLLLFSMMVLVAIFSETGIFDYLSVWTYKITNGRVWPLITTLCFFTAFMSSFLDNVTTALLMTPVSIRLCEVMTLNPVPILMAMMIYSNIGGAITPVGDPPNVIVASHPDVINSGVDFGVFFIHMFIGIIIVAIVVYVQLRLMFRNEKVFQFPEPQDVQELRHEIAIWQRAAASLSSYSKDEDVVKETLLKRVRRLLSELKTRLLDEKTPHHNYKANLEELQEKYPIKNWPLLYKSGLALIFVISVFFLHSIPNLNLSLGCTAFLGAMLLLLIADRENIEGVLARVEWTTLLFFASLFILMEALSRLRLIEWIGRQTEALILSVDKDYRLSVAIVLILWVSASASAFVDNIPLSTMMIRIVTNMAHNPEMGLTLMPLIWALCFGACLGGLATIIGSSSNVVCAGIAEQHGYRFTFVEYFKVGFPVMLVSLCVSTVYLMIVHVVIGWNT